MVGAHTPARCGPVREHGHARACPQRERSEAGFTLVELLVVMVIGAILMAVILPQLGTTRAKVSAPEMNVAGGAIWRGIQNYRLDNGHLPPAALLTGQHAQRPPGRTFANPGGGRYVERWPPNTTGGNARVYQAPSPTLPTTRDRSRAGRIYYYVPPGTRPLVGYLVAYSDTGDIVYRRSIGTRFGMPLG